MERKGPKCIAGKNPYGICSCCHADGRVCCISCDEKDSCNIVCGWISENPNTKLTHCVQKV